MREAVLQNDRVAVVSELIGRDRELGRLAELAADAAAGRGTLCLLAGEAGVGKTALARTALAASGFRTLEAAAPETPGPPYRPLPPNRLYLAADEWAKRLDTATLARLTPFAVPEDDRTLGAIRTEVEAGGHGELGDQNLATKRRRG